MEVIFLILAVIFLAYSNGANDNFKGVATLFGSGTTKYSHAIGWATVTTFAGSLAAIFLAQTLLHRFSGKGLVPDVVAASPEFLIAVAFGAAMTVILATIIGFPISTTHALTGALLGAGFMAVGSDVNVAILGKKFFLPLLLSPFIAAALSALLYVLFRMVRVRMKIKKEYCVCIGNTEKVIPIPEYDGILSFRKYATPEIKIAKNSECRQRYVGQVLGINCQKLLDGAHFLSAGMVSFARGLNDTPKIGALLLMFKGLGVSNGLFLVGVAIAIGGLLNARKVAETMSHKITKLNHGQGFTANLVTGFLVIFASRWGLPVSTTHASCGSIFGISAAAQQGNTKMIKNIVLSWVLTLPVATILSGGTFLIASSVFSK